MLLESKYKYEEKKKPKLIQMRDISPKQIKVILHTPPETPPKKKNLSSENSNNIFYQEDKCKIHLAELYTTNKRIEKINIELEEKSKENSQLLKKMDLMKSDFEKKNDDLFQDNLTQKTLINELINKNRILEENSSYFELVEFYERKIDDLKRQNIDNLNNYTESIRKLTQDISNNNRDEIWRKTLKKFEIEKIESENTIAEYQKKERKMFSRQKFFENYCKKAESQFEKFSKVSKQHDNQSSKICYLENEIKQMSFDITKMEKIINNLKIENANLLKENCNLNEYLHKIKPIIKLEWNEIKNTNEENFENLIRKSKNEEYIYNSKNIIILIDNVNFFLKTLQEATQGFDLSTVYNIVEDIKNYTVSLLKKIQSLTINQYHIINNCCEINYKLTELCERDRGLEYEFRDYIEGIKNICSKLLYELNPK